MVDESPDTSSMRTLHATLAPCKEPLPSSAPARLESPLVLSAATPWEYRQNARRVPWQWLTDHTFVPSWLPTPLRHPAAGYVFAVIAQGVAVLLTHLVANTFPSFAGCRALVFLAVVLVALNWGAGPSLLSAVVGLVLFEYVMVPRPFPYGLVSSVDDGGVLVLGMGVGLAVSLLIGSLEQSKRRAMAERATAQARERATRQVQERMDEFLATASHDIRSPLTAAIGFNDLAARRYERLASAVLATRPDLADQVERVQASINDAIQSEERLGRLVALLFDTAQVRAGKLEIHRVPFDLATVVQEHLMALRVANPHRTLHLEQQVEGPVQVVADADRIGQVVTNFVTNAMKYSNVEQPVEVRLATDGACAIVSVRDHGLGLPASEQERIWQRFYQAKGVRACRTNQSADWD